MKPDSALAFNTAAMSAFGRCVFVLPAWKSSSCRSYGDDVASMAWSIQNLISTQVLAVALGDHMTLANNKKVPMGGALV